MKRYYSFPIISAFALIQLSSCGYFDTNFTNLFKSWKGTSKRSVESSKNTSLPKVEKMPRTEPDYSTLTVKEALKVMQQRNKEEGYEHPEVADDEELEDIIQHYTPEEKKWVKKLLKRINWPKGLLDLEKEKIEKARKALEAQFIVGNILPFGERINSHEIMDLKTEQLQILYDRYLATHPEENTNQLFETFVRNGGHSFHGDQQLAGLPEDFDLDELISQGHYLYVENSHALRATVNHDQYSNRRTSDGDIITTIQTHELLA